MQNFAHLRFLIAATALSRAFRAVRNKVRNKTLRTFAKPLHPNHACTTLPMHHNQPERHMAASEAQRQHAAERNKKIAEFCRTNSGKEACEYFGVSLRTVRYAVAQAKLARWAHMVEE